MEEFTQRTAKRGISISPPTTRPPSPTEKTSTAGKSEDRKPMKTSEGSTTEAESESVADSSSELEGSMKYDSLIQLYRELGDDPGAERKAKEWLLKNCPTLERGEGELLALEKKEDTDAAEDNDVQVIESSKSACEKQKEHSAVDDDDSQEVETFQIAYAKANGLDPQALAFQPELRDMPVLNQTYARSKSQQLEDVDDQRFHPYGHRFFHESNAEYAKRFQFLREENKNLDPVTDWGFDSAAESRRSSSAKPDRLNPTALAFRPKERVEVAQQSNGSAPQFTYGMLRRENGNGTQAEGTGFEPEDLDGSEVVITINGLEYMAKLKLKGPGRDIGGF